MAKGKRSRDKYVSKGVHSNVSNSTRAAMRATITGADKMLNLKRCWRKGQNPWLTFENSNREQTNKLFIRVRANDHWGSPKEDEGYIMPSMKIKA